MQLIARGKKPPLGRRYNEPAWWWRRLCSGGKISFPHHNERNVFSALFSAQISRICSPTTLTESYDSYAPLVPCICFSGYIAIYVSSRYSYRFNPVLPPPRGKSNRTATTTTTANVNGASTTFLDSPDVLPPPPPSKLKPVSLYLWIMTGGALRFINQGGKIGGASTSHSTSTLLIIIQTGNATPAHYLLLYLSLPLSLSFSSFYPSHIPSTSNSPAHTYKNMHRRCT